MQIVAVDVTGVVYFGSEQVIFNLLHQGDFVPGAGKLQWIVTDSVSLETKFSSAYPKGIISITHASRFIVEFEDHWASTEWCTSCTERVRVSIVYNLVVS